MHIWSSPPLAHHIDAIGASVGFACQFCWTVFMQPVLDRAQGAMQVSFFKQLNSIIISLFSLVVPIEWWKHADRDVLNLHHTICNSQTLEWFLIEDKQLIVKRVLGHIDDTLNVGLNVQGWLVACDFYSVNDLHDTLLFINHEQILTALRVRLYDQKLRVMALVNGCNAQWTRWILIVYADLDDFVTGALLHDTIEMVPVLAPSDE